MDIALIVAFGVFALLALVFFGLAWRSRSQFWKFLLCFVALGTAVAALAALVGTQMEAPARSATTVKSEPLKPDPLAGFTVEQHLAEAGKLAHGTNADLNIARRHLGAIPQDRSQEPVISKQKATIQRRIDRRQDELNKEFQDRLKAEEIEKNPLQIVRSSWSREGFGLVSEWTVTFKNRGKKRVGNIKYLTEYYSETGNLVDRGGTGSPLADRTIQKVIEPGQTRTLTVNDGFLHSQASRARFEIVSFDYLSD